MRSVRSRLAVAAMVVTAVALLLAALFVLRGLRTSLLAQLDDSVSDQAIDYAVNVVDGATLERGSILNDLETLLVIFDDTGGEPWLANDFGVAVDEILAELPVADSLDLAEPLVLDASISSATETAGAESMRAAITPIIIEEVPELDFYVLVARSIEPIDRAVASTRNLLLVVLPLLVAVVGALAWWLAGRALRPVDRMRSAVDDIRVGDLRRRVLEPGTDDEVGRLAATMNAMLQRLEVGVEQQRRFVGDAAHELRTPLASMAAQLDVDASHPSAADPAATATALRGEVTRLQRLVDALLLLARADQGGEVVERRLVDLDDIARTASTALARPERVDVDLSGLAPVEVRGDEAMLRRLIDNLLANAARHASSMVRVATGQDDDGVWLVVEDDGTGIPVASRDIVFDRFVRLDSARTIDGGGSGLGLALAREIAAHHDGQLFVTDSEALAGARFVLRLPLR